ncbi:MAG: ABC transporter permease, partial [Pseudodonghicola sp.]
MVLSLAFVLLAWQAIVVITGTSPDVLPSPLRVLTMLWTFRAQIFEHSIPTLQETLIGLSVTIVVASIFAVISDFFPVVRNFVYPILVVSQTIPIIVIAPLMVIWFGYGLFPKIVVIVIVT